MPVTKNRMGGCEKALQTGRAFGVRDEVDMIAPTERPVPGHQKHLISISCTEVASVACALQIPVPHASTDRMANGTPWTDTRPVAVGHPVSPAGRACGIPDTDRPSASDGTAADSPGRRGTGAS
jgi:hypothetical protein